MRFLHTADIHLDSPLRSIAMRSPALHQRLTRASRTTLEAIVQLAIDENVDALVLVGDVFDDGVPDVAARTLFIAQLSRLRAAGVPVVLIRGNHDGLLEHGNLGDDIFLLDRERSSVQIGEVYFYGLSFEGRHDRDSLLPDYPTARPGHLHVGVMHTSLGGSPNHDPYAPCALDDLLAHGYDYWALGHIHKPDQHRHGGKLAVTPGIPQGRHVREPGRGAVALVTLGSEGSEAEMRPVASLAFETIHIEIAAGLDQVEHLDHLAAELRTAARDDCDVALRVFLCGAGSAVMADDPAREAERLRQIAEDIEGVFIEMVRFEAETPEDAFPTAGAEMRAILAQEFDKTGLRDQARAVLDELRRALPAEARDAVTEDALEELLDEAGVMARALLCG